jgi:capsular polysaccharide biosynthesis protein
MKTLTPAEVAQIQSTLALARSGKATLPQLVAAHNLAEDATLNHTLGELRAHIRSMVPCPSKPSKTRNLLWGFVGGMIASSIVDFYVYRALDRLHTNRTEY